MALYFDAGQELWHPGKPWREAGPQDWDRLFLPSISSRCTCSPQLSCLRVCRIGGTGITCSAFSHGLLCQGRAPSAPAALCSPVMLMTSRCSTFTRILKWMLAL